MKLQFLLQVSALAPSVLGQLHTAAKLAGLDYFGTETESPSFNDQPYQVALKNTSDFGQITPGNSMKWDSIEPQPNKFSFTAGDKIASLAKANGQLLRCHNLVWHQQLPAWVTGGTWTKDTLTAALKNHITNEVTHYKGQCYAWDVVNEALEDNGTFRNDVFFRVLGQDYIKIAFETAAAADPDTKLYYNDFNIESPGKKSTAAQGIIKTLKAAGVKVDGAGFQAHFTVGGTPSKAVQMANLQAFTALGVEVAITELDIRMKLPSTDALIAQQKKDYATSTSACVAVKGCVGITVWDFDDKYSWIPSTFPGTGDGCIFDNSVTRKQAYFGALAGLTPASASAAAATASSGNRTAVTAEDRGSPSMSQASAGQANSTTAQNAESSSVSQPSSSSSNSTSAAPGKPLTPPSSAGGTNSSITPPILQVGSSASKLGMALLPIAGLSLMFGALL